MRHIHFITPDRVHVLHVPHNFEGLDRIRDILDVRPMQKTLMPGVYVGPRPEMMSSWCSNVLAIFNESGVKGVTRVERYIRHDSAPLDFDPLTQTMFTSLKELDGFNYYPASKLLDGTVHIDDLEAYCKRHAFNFDQQDLLFYRELFSQRLKRNPTVAELHDLANTNSEHSRHHLFRARLSIQVPMLGTFESKYSMMDMIKSTLNEKNEANSCVAFCDNASAITPAESDQFVERLIPSADSHHQYSILASQSAITFTAETHNFPTGIAPFEGANTGTGGRIRDTQCIGRGGRFVAGTAGYCVGESAKVNRIPPREMLLKASDGASDYGNKIGEPLIQGFCRAYGDSKVEWTKPIMFSGGIGHCDRNHFVKEKPRDGMCIIRIGGPTYRIGIGGGAASSSSQQSGDESLLSAVQRGDPQCENRLDRWLRACLDMGPENPILALHDQGAGGMANVTKEILDECVSAEIDLNAVTLGDPTLSGVEIWVSESQEQITALIDSNDLKLVQDIAFRERIHLDCVGTVSQSYDAPRIKVKYQGRVIVDLPLKDVSPPVKTFPMIESVSDVVVVPERKVVPVNWHLAKDHLFEMLAHVDVGSKRFLTSKVDRSVGGLVAQQQCVGPLHTPVSNVAVIADGFWSTTGACTAIGERTITGLSHHLPERGYCENIEKRIRWSIYEMVTNIMWAASNGLETIKCSANWMWPASSSDEEKTKMFMAVKIASDVFKELNIAVDGGKDSVSMSARLKTGEVVNSPGTLVVSGYAACPDIRLTVTPGLKAAGSILLQMTVSDSKSLVSIYEIIQRLLRSKTILSGHDVSDGGLVSALCEMAFAADAPIGIRSHLVTPEMWFNDEPAVIIEVHEQDVDSIMSTCRVARVKVEAIASTIDSPYSFQLQDVINIPMNDLRNAWESSATAFERMQSLQSDHAVLTSIRDTDSFCQWHLNTACQERIDNFFTASRKNINVAIIRGEGTNGDREMAAVLHSVGFTVYDYTTSDLCDGRVTSLDHIRGIIFPGGFTFSDALGSAAGWYHAIARNPLASEMIRHFVLERNDTFVLGVCNGCQLLARLGLLGKDTALEANDSGRFESRFVTVEITPPKECLDKNVWFRDLDGVKMGVWVAHGEGKFTSSTPPLLSAMKYVSPIVDSDSSAVYPFNPNGSSGGTAAIVSLDGRILGMMPHPERCFKNWQVPWRGELFSDYTPWVLLFENALKWCLL